MNMNTNNKNSQKDLAFNYYFGMQSEQGKKGVESRLQNQYKEIFKTENVIFRNSFIKLSKKFKKQKKEIKLNKTKNNMDINIF